VQEAGVENTVQLTAAPHFPEVNLQEQPLNASQLVAFVTSSQRIFVVPHVFTSQFQWHRFFSH